MNGEVFIIRTGEPISIDYLIAVACGAVGGMVDIFLVGAPGDSVLGKWTDAQVDNAVKGFAKIFNFFRYILKLHQ